MKYNFDKLLGIPKYQGGTTGEGIKLLVDLTDLTRTNRYTGQLGWSGADRQWLTEEGQYDFEKMYQDYLQNKGSFNLKGIIATPDWENATADKKGYLEWNRLYNTSGLNKYFGYSDSQADYYGPTTSARKSFLDYIKHKESELPAEEGVAEDLLEGPVKELSIKQETALEEPVQANQYKALTPEGQYAMPKQSPWTDWAPLSMLLFNNLASAKKLAELQKQMKFPLVQAPFEQFKIKNQYHLRSQMLQLANNLRTLGAYRSNSSDLRENLDNMLKYDTLATAIETQAEQVKAEADAKDRQTALLVANRNTQKEVEAANINTRANVAAWNNILDAKARYDLRKTEALNSFIGNMYTSHGEWLKDARLNELAYKKGLNAQEAILKQQDAYNEYYAAVNDFTKSKAYTDFVKAVGDSDEILVEDPNDQAQLKALWAGDSALAQEYKAKWEDEKQQALTNYFLTNQNIANELAYKNLLLPAIINNQGFRFLDRPVKSNIHPAFRLYSRGGSLRARLIDYENHVQKEQLKQKELQHKRNELSQKRLIADLDRLSREQSILLRSVFK